jgi:peroxiredoxin
MNVNQSISGFTLPDLDGIAHSLNDYFGKIVIVNFWSAECPQSERTDGSLLENLCKWGDKVIYLPVASNLNESPQMIAAAARQRGLNLVLLDQSCGLADAWQAQTTPHAFVVDSGGVLRYQGAVDDVTFRKRMAQKFYVAEAVDAILAGRLPEIQEMPPYGCTVVRMV